MRNVPLFDEVQMTKMKMLPKMIIIGALTAGAVFACSKFSTHTPSAVPTGNVLTAIAQVVQGSSYERIMSTRTATVSVQSPSMPFFEIRNGTNIGFNAEFMNILFAQAEFAGTTPIVVKAKAVDTYPAVPLALREDSSVDLAIDGLTFDDGTPSDVVYTIPYIEDFGYAAVTTKVSSMSSEASLAEATVGILAGDPDVKKFVLSKFPKAKIIELSDASTTGGRTWINDALKSGTVDAVIYDYPFATSEIASTDLQFLATKLSGSDIKYRIGVRAGDTQLLEALNKAIRKSKLDPKYSDMLRKYFATKNAVSVQASTAGEQAYVVKAGDTLSTISMSRYGGREMVRNIETRNNLPNPNLIFIGQKLILPVKQ